MNVAELYRFFSAAFPEDSDFWKKLAEEEENHARIIKIGKEVYISCDEFQNKLLSTSLDELIDVNKKLASLLKKYGDKPPSRKEAFNVAKSLEESAGEIHYQYAMNQMSFSDCL